MPRLALAVCAVAVTAACTGDETGTPASTAATGPAQPRCVDVFRTGEIIEPDAARDGCLDATGTVQQPTSVQCVDGRVLWSVDASTGAPGGWGFSGEEYQASSDAQVDKEYNKAYEKCAE